MSLIDGSPQSVTIVSVYQQANILPGSAANWPILQRQQFVSPSIFWNIIKVAGSKNQFYIQDYQNRYLAPGGDANSCVLRDQKFAWQIVQSAGDIINPVNVYNISEPSDPENLLQSGYRFEEPSNAYAVVSEGADPKSALASWVIAKMPNY